MTNSTVSRPLQESVLNEHKHMLCWKSALGVSIVIALFCRSFFALRVSGFVTAKVGAAHGFVITSAFFLLMLLGLGNVIGGLAGGFGGLAKIASSGANELARNPAVQDVIQRALGSSNLKSDSKEVAQELSVRLLRGDTESAANYIAYQTGQSRAGIDARVVELRSQFEAAAKITAEKTAHANVDLSFDRHP